MYAIIETGGKQYKVSEGDTITVEKLELNAGEALSIDKVLVVKGEGEPTFGAPYVNGASVSATSLGDGKAKKVIIYKFKRKSGYHKKKGHRQPFTKLKIDKINV